MKAVLEGADHYNPEYLHYAHINVVSIPENVQSVLMGQRGMYMVGKVEDFIGKEIDPTKYSISDSLDKWNVLLSDRPEDKTIAGWIFGMPRSLTLDDGRIYVVDSAFERGFDYCLRILPTVAKDAFDMLNGLKGEDELNALGRSAF